jgi:hypothetical protein
MTNKQLKDKIKKIYGYELYTNQGKSYRVSPSGNILQFGNTYNKMGKSWRLKGFTKHHWSNSPIPFKEAIKDTKNISDAIVWDIDHNTTRRWGTEKVKYFSPINSRTKWKRLQKGGYN